MPSKFTVAQALEPLDWDFTACQPATPAEVPWRGTVPEPSQAAIRAFQEALRAVSPTADPSRVGELAEGDSALDTLKDAIVTLAGGSPSKAILDAVPFRGFMAFAGWLTERLLNPR